MVQVDITVQAVLFIVVLALLLFVLWKYFGVGKKLPKLRFRGMEWEQLFILLLLVMMLVVAILWLNMTSYSPIASVK